MSTVSESTASATAQWVGRTMLKIAKFLIELGLLVLGLMTLMYVQHVFSLLPLYLSGEIASRPDAEEAFVSSANWSAIHILVLGPGLLLWLWLHRLLHRSGN